MSNYSPDLCHENLIQSITPALRYREENDFNTWKNEVKAKLTELVGDMPERVAPNVQIEWKKRARDLYGISL